MKNILSTKNEKKNKRSEILNMCAHFFYEKGYRGTNLDEVAEVLEITKPAIYYYFKSKDEILCELYSTTMDYLLEHIESIFYKNDSSITKLKNMITMHVQVVTTNIPLITIVLQEQKELPIVHRKNMKNKNKKYGDYFLQVIQKGINDGEFIDANAFLLTQNIIGMCNGLLTWYDPKGNYTSEQLCETIISIVMKGVIVKGSDSN